MEMPEGFRKVVREASTRELVALLLGLRESPVDCLFADVVLDELKRRRGADARRAHSHP